MKKNISLSFSKFASLNRNKKCLLAVSGGLDSMVLLNLFTKEKLTFEVAHGNFQLRGNDSNLDQQLVEDFCKKHQIFCHVKKFKIVDKPQHSIQMQARDLRYDWFNQLLKERQFNHLVTAHHANDQIETFLINLTRGSGLVGLSGIAEDKILRPLLSFTKSDILEYALSNKIQFRADSSNAETKYLRNQIRHNIIPKLEEMNPSFILSANKSIDILKKHQDFFKAQSQQIFKNIVAVENDIWLINIEKLTTYKHYDLLLFDWLQPFGFKAWDDIYGLIDAQTGKKVFSDSHQLLKNRHELILSKILIKDEKTFVYNKLEDFIFDNKRIKIEELNFSYPQSSILNPQSVVIDKNSLKFPLTIRKFKKGDYFYPFGMTGKKLLSKFFKDEKFSQIQKDNTWLLCMNDQIIWVINYRIDDRFKVKLKQRTY